MSDETMKRRCAACCNASSTLKKCAACKSVWYCNRTCQQADRKAHRSMCKTIEKARKNGAGDVINVPDGGKLVMVSSTTHTVGSINDKVGDASGPSGASALFTAKPASTSNEEDGDLFALPPPREDCPVCMVMLPLLNEEAVYKECCGKLICRGCIYENGRVLDKTNTNRMATNLPPLDECCPFCRTKYYETDAEYMERMKKRVDLNDPRALHNMAGYYRNGGCGIRPNMTKAFELTQRAANLGLSDAIYDLGVCYAEGAGVARDPVKERYYLELAAKSGEVMARHNLGCMEEQNYNLPLACKHWMIAASAGGIGSLKK